MGGIGFDLLWKVTNQGTMTWRPLVSMDVPNDEWEYSCQNTNPTISIDATITVTCNIIIPLSAEAVLILGADVLVQHECWRARPEHGAAERASLDDPRRRSCALRERDEPVSPDSESADTSHGFGCALSVASTQLGKDNYDNDYSLALSRGKYAHLQTMPRCFTKL